ncbi:MAG: hypothetical protein RBU30_27085, partial [Polyangia bacterium]|nr:hypothetical protein [Polyangia bacterium]
MPRAKTVGRASLASVARITLAPLIFLGAACPGSSGELGEEHFVYRCAGISDPYCDAVLYDSYCYGTCERPFDGNLDEEVPGTIALGSRFMVLADPRGLSAITPISVSPSIVEWEGDAFRAVSPGEVALLATEDNIAEDYIYIRVVEPVGMRVDHIDEVGKRTRNISALTLATGDEGWLRAYVVDQGGEYLYGALPCLWSTEDSTNLEVVTDPTDNLVRFT